MATVAFDTMRISRRLQDAGFSVAQAEMVTSIVFEATDLVSRDLVTNKDLEIKLAPIRADILLVKWMLGVVIALLVAVFLKLFLP